MIMFKSTCRDIDTRYNIKSYGNGIMRKLDQSRHDYVQSFIGLITVSYHLKLLNLQSLAIVNL